MRGRHLKSLVYATCFSLLVLTTGAISSAATKVLVLPLHSVGEPGSYSWISQAVADDLQSVARQNPSVQVLSLTQPPTESTAAAALAAGTQAGADITIFGSYQVVADNVRVSCTAIDATGQTLASPAATGAVRDLFTIEDKLAAEIQHVLPAPPATDASTTNQAATPAPAPYTLINPGTYNLTGVTDTPAPLPGPAPATSQVNPEYYYVSTPSVYYLPEYSVPPVYYPDTTSYCYTTCEPFYGGFYVVPNASYYGGFNEVYGYGGIGRSRANYGGVAGGGYIGGGSLGGRNFATPGRTPTANAGAIRPPWGNAPTPLRPRTVPLNAAGNVAHLGNAPSGFLGGLGGRR